MGKKVNVEYWLPLSLFLLMLVDGQVSNFLRISVENEITLNCHLLLLIMLFGSFQCSKQFLVICATIFGALYDNYYYSIIGINMLCLPLLVYMIYTIFEYIEPSVFSLLLTFIICVTFMEVATLLMGIAFKLIDVDILYFITNVLGPTLLLNVTIFVLLIYPMKKFFLDKAEKV